MNGNKECLIYEKDITEMMKKYGYKYEDEDLTL